MISTSFIIAVSKQQLQTVTLAPTASEFKSEQEGETNYTLFESDAISYSDPDRLESDENKSLSASIFPVC